MTITEKIIHFLVAHPPKTSDDFSDALRKILRQTKTISLSIPAKSELIKSYHKLVKRHKIKKSVQLEKMLVKRAVRTLSGVSIITVLTKPFPCPGKCVYCPSEARMPKSYLSDEPAAARALGLMFDPYQQVMARIKALENNGHPTDKIELIVKGGTWNAYPLGYQYWFIARCFEAANDIKTLKQKNIKANNGASENFSLDKLQKMIMRVQKKNEAAKHRVIGLTLETRPDFINEKNIKIMRELGCTRIELGVQTTNEKILRIVKRGHGANEVKRATKLLKNYGFKVDYHLMPQLPGATPATDLKMMLEIFDNPDYRPDMIKVYPCTVVKTSKLYDWLKRGEYKTYSDRQLINLLKKFKTRVPRYIRISRLIRDIPGHHIHAGNTMTNLRQVIQEQMKKEGLKCKCLRCREIGHMDIKTLKHKNIKTKPKLFIDKYEASGGIEYFISFEDKNRDAVYAFCRLRLITANCEPRTENCCAFIRELHTYGQLTGIGKKEKGATQHKGLGVKLVEKAEDICRAQKIPKLAVISGVGVRGYYKKLGYDLEDTYMIKNIKICTRKT